MEKDPAKIIASGYDFEGASLELGNVVIGKMSRMNCPVRIPLAMMNRHGLIAGATGTGKTKTLQQIAEQLSSNGVPVVMADIKGDLSGLSKAGNHKDEKLLMRAVESGDSDWEPTAFPVEFFSLGTKGNAIPVRATVDSFGPILMSKVLGLNATQESCLGLIFHWAKKNEREMHDLDDLRSVITYLMSDEGKADLKSVGSLSSASCGIVLRALINLEAEGGDTFFGTPKFDVEDLLRVVGEKGIISLFETDSSATTIFSTFLMWVLEELFKILPEEGDLDKPKLVFIFDEAHLLFNEASKAFIKKVEQTVKLIRSKGVGVFFCSQLPNDIPNKILSQLGARIQHAIRAFTPEDQNALVKVVKTYPNTDYYNVAKTLTSMGIGQALVTVLSEVGAPTPVAVTQMRPPRSMMGTIGNSAIEEYAKNSTLASKYFDYQEVIIPEELEVIKPEVPQTVVSHYAPATNALNFNSSLIRGFLNNARANARTTSAQLISY